LTPAAVFAASATANSTADIVAAISIAKDTGGDLGFGYAVASGTAGTVVIANDGTRTCNGGVTCIAGGTTSAASFTVTGQANYTYAITLPSSVTLTDGASNNMTVDTFTSNPATTGTIGSGGSQTIAVGATLNVTASQAAGTYTGTFDVSVDYN
jgi:hypothetical protein